MTDGEYTAHIAIMKYMGWGWQELMEAPAALVEEVACLMEATSMVERARESERRRA